MIFNPNLSKQAQEIASFNSFIQLYSVKQQFISETPWFNIRYKVKLFGTYKKYYQNNWQSCGPFT